MARESRITGQIVLREASDQTICKDDPNRKLMIVVGAIAVPKDYKLKGECKYTVGEKKAADGLLGLFQLVDSDFGEKSEFEEITIILYPETEEDISSETQGNSAGGILTSHHRWRV